MSYHISGKDVLSARNAKKKDSRIGRQDRNKILNKACKNWVHVAIFNMKMERFSTKILLENFMPERVVSSISRLFSLFWSMTFTSSVLL